MPISPAELLDEVKCFCGTGASTAQLIIIALLQRIAEGSCGECPENLEGADSPLNVVTPDFVGQVYVQTGGIIWQAGSTASSSWTVICEGGGGGEDLFLFDSGDTLEFSSTALTSLTTQLWITESPFVTVSLPNLETSTNYVEIDVCDDLESINLDSLISCGDGAFGLYLSSNPLVASISLPALTTVSG